MVCTHYMPSPEEEIRNGLGLFKACLELCVSSASGTVQILYIEMITTAKLINSFTKVQQRYNIFPS